MLLPGRRIEVVLLEYVRSSAAAPGLVFGVPQSRFANTRFGRNDCVSGRERNNNANDGFRSSTHSFAPGHLRNTPMPNLWPDDFGTFTLTPPITILREQAEFLGKKT